MAEYDISSNTEGIWYEQMAGKHVGVFGDKESYTKGFETQTIVKGQQKTTSGLTTDFHWGGKIQVVGADKTAEDGLNDLLKEITKWIPDTTEDNPPDQDEGAPPPENPEWKSFSKQVGDQDKINEKLFNIAYECLKRTTGVGVKKVADIALFLSAIGLRIHAGDQHSYYGGKRYAVHTEGESHTIHYKDPLELKKTADNNLEQLKIDEEKALYHLTTDNTGKVTLKAVDVTETIKKDHKSKVEGKRRSETIGSRFDIVEDVWRIKGAEIAIRGGDSNAGELNIDTDIFEINHKLELQIKSDKKLGLTGTNELKMTGGKVEIDSKGAFKVDAKGAGEIKGSKITVDGSKILLG